MKVAAITKFKHGALFQLLAELGWSQTEFAKRVGISAAAIGDVVNMLRRPSEETIAKMQAVFDDVGKDVSVASFFPDSYIGFKRALKVVQIEDVEPHQLAEFQRHQTRLLMDAQPPLPSDICDTEDKLQQIYAMLENTDGALSEREVDVVRTLLIENKPSSELEERYGVTHQAIYNVRDKALRKIRDRLVDSDKNRVLDRLPSKEFIRAHSSLRTDELADEDAGDDDDDLHVLDPRRVGYEHLWTAQELAGYFNRSCETIRRWTKQDKIPCALIVGGLPLYDHEAVNRAWLKMNKLIEY